MSWQDLGSIGELIAAIATIATLAYLAVQVSQNTRALRSSTFQNISEQMAQNMEVFVGHPEVAELLLKGLKGLGDLSPADRMRFQSVLVMSFRRMEAVHVQVQLGSIDADLVRGFERSLFLLLHSPGAGEWWAAAKITFNTSFAEHVDSWLAANEPSGMHPSLGIALSGTAAQQDVLPEVE